MTDVHERGRWVTGVEVAVGFLVTWVLGRASRAARRADAVADQVVDTGVDKLGRLILDKLGTDPAVERLQVEAGEQGRVSDRTTKWSVSEVRRGWRRLGGVVEVEAAGAVEGFFGSAGGESARQELVFVPVAAGEVQAEAPLLGGAAVAQSQQGLYFAIG
jgi:hypothetical protein